MPRHKNRITIGNNKGGVGKTTTTVELCAHAVYQRKKTLIVDADPQANASRIFLGYKPGAKDTTLFDVLLGEADVTDALKKATDNWPGVYVLPGSQKLESAHKFLESEPGWETALDEIIESIEDNFDLILIDSPPALGLLTKIAIRAANKVLIPTDTSIYGEEAVTKMFALIEHIEKKTKHKVELVRVVLAAMQKGGAYATREALSKLKTEYGDSFLPIELPHTVKVMDAQRAAVPKAAAQILQDDHKLYTGYKQLLESII
ncbi:MAG TPA: AAA family ATPase [Oligoflexus sp.]|uniref:ParA family protein n=1 Tax=Oligoflexus sp. TaxID=1971216 RepID=UPI002D80C345|nr:AAA family ATPase [Oligoflexus sp.]HET9239184.1 AAA family ATPase [Oligoflexus sp.]